MRKLFEPLTLGELKLSHRIVMAPLTRNRANRETLVPTRLAQDYYSQRATKGGLLITEATLISSEGLLDHGIPGIWKDEQVKEWKQIVDAVHSKGGLVSIQLWHTGRCAHGSFKSHPAVEKGYEPSVSASDVPVPTSTRQTFTGEKLPYTKPRPLGLDEIPRVIQDYVHAAKNAKRAGFDCIELHAAHGYLIDQFMNNGTNRRTDKYGGSIENRCRLLLEVVEALQTVYPPGRIGVRISPHAEKTMKYYGTDDSNPDALYAHAIHALDKYNLAYLLLTEPRWFGVHDKDFESDPGFKMPLINPAKFRHLYSGKIIGAGGFTPSSAEDALQSNEYDAIAFGRWFIANPDLVHRIREGLPFNKYERKTFYTDGPHGYTDYPFFDQVQDKASLVPQDRIGRSLGQSNL